MNAQSSFHVTRWWSNQPLYDGFWGQSTSSIDWCEANYAISRYIAEFANTLSNLVFVSWALFGIKKCRDEKLPLSLALCQVGIALVGIGSFLFHATLKYEWQLGDELPMIFCSCFITYVAFDTGRSPSILVRALPFFLSLYALTVTVIYLNYPNPVFHQVSYGFIQLLATIRVAYVIQSLPNASNAERRNRSDVIWCETFGTGIFLLGFLFWNLDNLFCDQISKAKAFLGVPWSFVLEGHAWWHLATGTGAYFIVIGIQLLSLDLKEGADGVELRWGGPFGWCPYVGRIPIKIDSKTHTS
ncbi:hypothetical protein O181_055295 [Austropuccinia psidii MF-1]|uniref:Alkaline phytoceramidase n=1 Tax=Austropuccinia psidii MF-1 TaxID=1389203 RepID=A0A9Q3E418_9BASI|nr:hypothetical protein [Austropuccinia psidii MF-1]